MAGITLEPDQLASVAGLLSVAVGPASGVRAVQEVTFFDRVTLTFNFDQGDQVTFAVPAYSPEAGLMDELATDVFVEGVLRQRFRIVKLDQAWDEHGADIVSVTAVSYKRLARARHVQSPLVYTGLDQGEIVWNLIAHTQATPGGSWGVTKGTVTTGVTRDRQYVPGNNIGQMLANLSEVINGPWWGVDADKVLTVKMPATFPHPVTPIQLGATARRLVRQSTAEAFANAVYVDGGGDTVPVTQASATIATDPRGRWEKALGFPTVIQQPTLTEHAAGALQAAMSPPAVWNVVMEPYRWRSDARYLPGDLCTLVIPPSLAAGIGAPAVKVGVQIVEAVASVSAAGELGVTLSAVEVVS